MQLNECVYMYVHKKKASIGKQIYDCRRKHERKFQRIDKKDSILGVRPIENKTDLGWF